MKQLFGGLGGAEIDLDPALHRLRDRVVALEGELAELRREQAQLRDLLHRAEHSHRSGDESTDR